MAGPNLDPDAVAGQPMGDEHGGNTDQPEQPEETSGEGMTTENAGALVGAAGLAKARKAAAK